MLLQAWMTTRRALSHGGTWTGLVWTIGFGVVLVACLVAAGAHSLLTTMVHRQIGRATPYAAAGHPFTGLIVIYLVLLGIGPFFIASLYGLYGAAVQDHPIVWRTFWTMGKKLYGRGWGLYLYILIYVAVLGIILAILAGLLHGVGAVLTLLAVIASLPWILRMTGGLFVDQYTWGRSFKSSFRRSHYWSLLASMLLSVLAYGIILALALLVLHLLGLIGVVLYFALELVLGVAGPVWFFALYAATRDA